jgi:dienelactone hydrolase
MMWMGFLNLIFNSLRRLKVDDGLQSRMSKILAILSLLLCFARIGSAQTLDPKIFDPVKVQFRTWQLVTESEESIEYLVQFDSAEKSGFIENDRVQMRVILPAGVEKPPMVMILHYWGAPNLRVERALSRELNERGIGAAIIVLPYHLSRTPAGAVSGAMAIQPDPVKLNSTMRQAVLDVRRGLDFLQSRSECGRLIGIYGTSLGAIISSLSYAVDERLSNAVFLLGGVDLAKIVWDSSLTLPIREGLRSKGWNELSLSTALEEVEPSRYLREKPNSRTLIIRANYDSVIPKDCTDALIRLLPSSQVLSLDTGHYGGLVVQGRLLRETANFFASVADNKVYRVPEKIISPTIRVGFMGRTSGRFDVSAGFDLIRFSKSGKEYASLLLTTRDPVIWVGTEIVKGVNFGIGLSRKDTGIGIFWSTVL